MNTLRKKNQYYYIFTASFAGTRASPHPPVLPGHEDYTHTKYSHNKDCRSLTDHKEIRNDAAVGYTGWMRVAV